MLDSMDAGHLTEWAAFYKIEEEERKRDELAAKAQAGVKGHRRKGR